MADKHESAMKSNKQSISTRMMILFFFTVIIPVALMGVVFYQYMTNSLQQEIMHYSVSAMKEKNEFIDLLVKNITHTARVLSHHEDIPSAIRGFSLLSSQNNIDSFQCFSQLKKTFTMLTFQQGISKLQLLGIDGKGIEFNVKSNKCSVTQGFLRQLDVCDIQDPNELQWIWNSDDFSENNELIAWIPLFDAVNQNKEGYLLLFLDMSFLRSRLKGEDKYEQYYAILDENLTFLYHSQEQRIGTILKAEYLNIIQQKGSAPLYDFNHQLSIMSYSVIKSTNWSFFSFIPYRYIQQRTVGVLHTTFGLILLLLILVCFFGWYLSKYYLAPLNKIIHHFKSFQSGKIILSQQLEEKGNNEISELTQWYNLFFSNLKEKEIIDKKLVQSQAEYQHLVDSIQEVLFRMNQSSQLVFVSSAWEEITSYPIQDALSSSLIDFIHPGDKAIFEDAFNTLLKEKTELKVEVRFIKSDQSNCWIEILARLDEKISEKDGEVFISGVMIDVTERKELDELKDNFINAVCHEIKTPFTSFKQGIQILQDGETDEISKEEKDYVFDTLNKNVSRLQRLLDDLFIYKRIDEGAENYIIQQNNLNHLLWSIVEEMRSQAEDKKLSLELVQDPLLKELEFDRDKVGIVIKKILDNAIRYTQQGGIKVSTQLREDKVLVSIQDTGIGIKPNDFSKLFQQFSQISRGLNRTTGGTGLGLVIARKIIEKHNGSIKVESEVGKGSCFTIELPLKSA